jgi:hypothetical protein
LRANGDVKGAERLLALIPQEQADNLKALTEADSAFDELDLRGGQAARRVEERQKHLIALLNAQRNEIELLEPAYRQSSTDLNAVRDARATGDRLMEKAGEAIVAWQKAHRSLQAAAQGDQRRPSVAELISITTEIVTLLK